MARKSKPAAAVTGTQTRRAGRSSTATAVGAWLDRPSSAWCVVALAVAILAVPWWLMADELNDFALHEDDFSYISASLDWATLRANLLVPHNTHVVPIFRLGTFAVVAVAGKLENLPAVCAAASYLGLVVAMLVVGHLTARESGQVSVGLAAMAFLGFSSLVGPAVRWYAAGQALWAGAAVVVTVLLARQWSEKGGAWLLGTVCLAALAATALWSGGLVAGPAALAYLAVRDRSRARRPILVLAAVTAGSVLAMLVASRDQITGSRLVWEQHPGLWPRPIQAVFHSAQAVAEELFLGNLGLDAVTTHWQAVALVLGLAGLWAWSRGGWRRASPLEAAGATMILGSYLLAYAFRGNLTYLSLRPIGWYHAIPQVGASLFVAGWWTGLRRAGPPATDRFTRGQALGLLGLMAGLCVLQVPRGERALIEAAPKLTSSEAVMFPIPRLKRLRAVYFKAEFRDRQRRALAHIDRAGPIAARLGASRELLRRVFGPIRPPGIPDRQTDCDAFSLFRIPSSSAGSPPTPARLHAALDDLLRPEPQARPPWLPPADPWPPR